MATGPGLAMKMTADTVGISRGITKTEKMLLDLSKSTRRATSALRGLVAIEIGKMFTSAVTSISGFVDNVRQSVGELTKLAQVSNTSVERFQGLAVAAKSVGIEQDKLADIFKDVGDRVGDFLQTGGGPMADFFENIAPLVGVTAEQFAQLSGPEALQLYVDSLQKAGLSQAEMTFYLEAMSSDLTALLPLLQDGGKGFDEIAARAERLGIVLSEDQTDAIKEMNGTLGLVYDTFEGIIGQVVGNLAPAVTAIAEEFLQFVEGYKGLGEGTGGTALADSITTALFDGAEYLAVIMDNVTSLLMESGMTFTNVGSSFMSAADIFGRVASVFQSVFNAAQSFFLGWWALVSGALAKFISLFSSEAAQYLGILSEELARNAENAVVKSVENFNAAFAESVDKIQGNGPLTEELKKLREEFEKTRNQRKQQAAAAESAAAEMAAPKQPSQEEKKQVDEDAKKREAAEKKIADMREELASAEFQYAMKNATDLAKVNQQALKVSDIRSSGIESVIALATGREDPAVEASRQQLRELQALRMSVEGLGQVVEIAGAA